MADTDIVVPARQSAPPAGSTEVAVTRPLDLLGGASFRDLAQAAGVLLKSGLLPESIRSPEQAVAVILQGRELGLPTMLSLRKIHVIKGVPTLAAEVMLALFKARGGRAQERKSTTESCTWWFRHPNGDEHIETYTIEDARREGLLERDQWRKMPRKMLRWRAISGGLKVVAPEIVAGLYTPEELGAQVDEEGELLEQPVQARARRAAESAANRPAAALFAPAESAEPEAQEADPVPEAQVAPPEPAYIGEADRRKLYAEARRRDLGGETETELKKIIAYVQDVPVDQVTTKRITPADLERIYDELTQYPVRG